MQRTIASAMRQTRKMKRHFCFIVACLLWAALNLHVTYRRVPRAASHPTPTTAPSATVARLIKHNDTHHVGAPHIATLVAPNVTHYVTQHGARVTPPPLKTPVKRIAAAKHIFDRRLPNCLVIGTMDSGADDLVGYLGMHKQIRVRQGETNFFHQFYDRGLEWYRNMMPLSHSDDVTVEMSVRYFEQPEVPERVHAMNSSMKLVVLLLPPVDRTVAHWLRLCRYVCNIVGW